MKYLEMIDFWELWRLITVKSFLMSFVPLALKRAFIDVLSTSWNIILG